MTLRFPLQARSGAASFLCGAGGSQLFVGLFVNPLTYSDDVQLSDLVPPSNPDYAPYNSALWEGPTQDTNGDAYFLSPALTWTRGPGGTGETVHGYYVTQGPPAADNLLALDLLVNPVPFVAPASVVSLYPIKVSLRGLLY